MKTLLQIMTEQQLHRDNFAASLELGFFKTKKVYKERQEEQKAEQQEISELINSASRLE